RQYAWGQRQACRRIADDDVVQTRAVRSNLEELVQLFVGRADDARAASIVEDVLDLPAQERRIDRNGDGGGTEDGEVGHRPFRTILSKDPDSIARLHAEEPKA